ncbi:hypothetical protein [Paraburkholderia phenoliruptrix]|uniref:hypothetical protein n=1 Tax=Paraburkholderia phenoliruptrix TaxID=252970 RepID=UPI001C6DE98A|nr:hypothetical protein [Paraburkholderia phenoliruptrix]MBW9102902.1 hypothetical protein [Paraburkholderia phenoliruptrix]MBW9132875.1 hypothetical protein [Paraburkholderia ginsengiterrae]
MAPQPNKEQVYDEQINPLMAQIIEICRAHKIAFVASFSIATAEDPDLACSSAMLAPEFDPPKRFVEAWNVLHQGRRSLAPPLMLRTENADGSTTLTAIIG